jgi:DNA-binding CsgD family transcriptional regulator
MNILPTIIHFPSETLTQREEEVLTLAAQGAERSAIAKKLQIAQDTVKYHNSQLCLKLAARNKCEAVAIAVALHLISPHHFIRKTEQKFSQPTHTGRTLSDSSSVLPRRRSQGK